MFGLLFGSIALSFVFIILLLLPHTFNAWKKFAVWFIPITALTFATYSGEGFFDPAPEQVFQWISMLYAGLSFGIIGTSIVSQYLVKQGKKPLHVIWYWVIAIALGYIAVINTSALVSILPF